MMPRVLRLLGTVVAPTTLLTGLLFYFGQTYVAGYCRYFGVNFTTLDLSVRDYLIRSVEGIFLPLVLAAASRWSCSGWSGSCSSCSTSPPGSGSCVPDCRSSRRSAPRSSSWPRSHSRSAARSATPPPSWAGSA